MMSVSARALALRLGEWRGDSPAYRALSDRIRLQILDGRLSVGTRLPAERELAVALGVSRTTVAAAYTALRDRGLIESLRGSGSVVRLPRGPVPVPDPVTEMHDLSKASLPAVPQLAEAARAAAELLPSHLGSHGFDLVGLPELRLAIANRYTQRGLPTEPDQIMVTVGAQHAMSLLFRTLIQRGDRVVIEHPTYPHAMDAVLAAGGRIVPISVDPEYGWDEVALEQAFARGNPAMAYLLTENHNPTGATMPLDLLERTLATAAATGTVVVIDESISELTIDGPNRAPAAAFGPAVLLGSVGKTLWGGVRIGWIRASPTLIDRLVRARSVGDLGTATLDQLVVAELMPQMDQILSERRALLRHGRSHVVERLRAGFPDWTIPEPAGGIAVWAGIGRPASSQLALAARANGLMIAAGPRFGSDGAFERFLRVPFCLSLTELDPALDVLERTWAGLSVVPGMRPAADLAAVV